MKRLRTRLGDEHGTALIIALMSMMLLTALGAAVVMVSRTETAIANNYRNSQEALYAADAAVERVVQDLLMVPRWNDILAGASQSSFIDGAMTSAKELPGGGRITLCCGAGTATGELQAETDGVDLWGLNNPQWRLFAWGPLSRLLDTTTIDTPMYVAVWVADDPADGPSAGAADGNPLLDANGTLTIRAEAIGPGGTRKVIEITVARTSGTEIERGQIAQRGQEELNQRARKAAVQTPGKSLTNMSMNTGTGNMGVH
ncbi:MAG TPA: pilus assembly PilX N-terminal domain-containing protein [Vicinamibacterales bacterium]|nr:pilus assembly PilX N-terminal domain-containing protein [Vicinamibacterales bacterium]